MNKPFKGLLYSHNAILKMNEQLRANYQLSKPISILDKLKFAHILRIDIAERKVRLIEACDLYHGYDLEPGELDELINTLQTIRETMLVHQYYQITARDDENA